LKDKLAFSYLKRQFQAQELEIFFTSCSKKYFILLHACDVCCDICL